MKLVIHTQCEENYGSHDWDGKGSCPQYWKFKGGNVYVVRNLTQRQCRKIAESGIPTLSKLLTEENLGFREYVMGWTVCEDDVKECQDWETPTVLHYNVSAGQWRASRVTHNDGEHGYMHHIIRERIERWNLTDSGPDCQMTYYRLCTGELVNFDTLEIRLSQLEGLAQ